MIKLIATDIDGTLLNYDRTIPDRLMPCLESLEKHEIKVVPVTGRMYKAAIKIYRQLDFKDALITYQGGQVNDSDGKIIYQKVLDTDTVKKGIDWARTNNVHLQIYTNDNLYVENDNDFVKRYSYEQNVPYETVNFDDLDIHYASKMLAIDFNNPEKVTEWVQELKKMFPECFIVKSTPNFAEISHKNANKYDAVKFLQNYYGLKDDEVLTIGDQNNDLALLQAGGIRVAMGNATEELKSCATYITDDVKDNGWVSAVEHFCLNRIY